MSRRSISDKTKDQVDALAHRPQPKETPKKRQWEAAQRHHPETTQVSYRGIPRDLNAQIKAIAQEHDLTVSQVAGLFLARGLAAYEAGETLAEMAEIGG